MAIATTQGHVQRALEFYQKSGKYFVLGGTEPWNNNGTDTPIPPSVDDYKLNDIIGFKKVDSVYIVKPTDESPEDVNDPGDIILYQNQNWKKIPLPPEVDITVTGSGISAGSKTFSISDKSNLSKGSKLRIDSKYVVTVETISATDNFITVDNPITESVNPGAIVEYGALVEGAKYVYVDCYLNYDQFPVDVTYRQIGLCTEVKPVSTESGKDNVLRSSKYTGSTDEYQDVGVLEVIDNRAPTTRSADMREHLSFVFEF